jgi:hypothetical protein
LYVNKSVLDYKTDNDNKFDNHFWFLWDGNLAKIYNVSLEIRNLKTEMVTRITVFL